MATRTETQAAPSGTDGEEVRGSTPPTSATGHALGHGDDFTRRVAALRAAHCRMLAEAAAETRTATEAAEAHGTSVELPASYFGEVERFELVRMLCDRLNVHGRLLTDSELDWTVQAHELGEELLAASRFAEAATVFELLLSYVPSDCLAMVKLAVVTVAIHPSSTPASDRAVKLLRDAVKTEATNRQLSSLVELVLRLMSGDAVPDALWSAEVPKSRGLVTALTAHALQEARG